MILILSCMVADALWHDNLSAQFGLIDDHEVVEWLGAKNVVTLQDAKGIITSSEAFHPGTTSRYRPTYYILRSAEAYFWGGNPESWYQTRMVLFVLSLAIAWALTARLGGLGISTVFVLYALTAPYWGPIWAMLGPAETYACAGLALYFLGFYICWNAADDHWREGGWALVFLGTLLSAGSKENFVLLIVPTLYLVWVQYRAGRISKDHAIFPLLSIGFCLFVGISVAQGNRLIKQDIYAQPVDSGRLKPLQSELSLANPALWIFLLILLASGVLLVLSQDKNSKEQVKRFFAKVMLMDLTLYACYASLIVVYNGIWGMDSRYAFPGELILLAMAAYPLFLFLSTQELPGRAYMKYLRVCLVICGFLLVAYKGFGKNQQFAKTNSSRTQTLHQVILRGKAAASEDAGAAMILYTSNLSDFEAIYAVRRYLVNAGVKNPVMVEKAPDYGTGGFSAELAPRLMKSLDDMVNGDSGFTPRNSLKENQFCYSIGFTAVPNSGKCKSLGKVSP